MSNSTLFETESIQNFEPLSISQSFSINLNSRDLKYVKILNEQWTYPLKGFMNEFEYLTYKN